MTIQEALEKGNGKDVKLPDDSYAHLYLGILSWTNGNAVHLDTILRTDWLPYEEPKAKCRACLKAEELKETTGAYTMVDHLRTYHCECKGKK